MAKLLTLNQLYQLFLALNASLGHDAAFESIVGQYNLSVEVQHALADFIDDAANNQEKRRNYRFLADRFYAVREKYSHYAALGYIVNTYSLNDAEKIYLMDWVKSEDLTKLRK